MLEHEGRVAFVTGATRGIGRASAIELAAQGSAVAVHGLELDEARGVVAEIESLDVESRFFLIALDSVLGPLGAIDVPAFTTTVRGDFTISADAPLGGYHLVAGLRGSALWVTEEQIISVG